MINLGLEKPPGKCPTACHSRPTAEHNLPLTSKRQYVRVRRLNHYQTGRLYYSLSYHPSRSFQPHSPIYAPYMTHATPVNANPDQNRLLWLGGNIVGVRTVAALFPVSAGCAPSSPGSSLPESSLSESSLPDPAVPAAFPSRTRVSSIASPSVNRMVTGIINESVEVEVRERGIWQCLTKSLNCPQRIPETSWGR